MVVTGLSPFGRAASDMAPLVPLFAPYCGGMAQQKDLQKALDRLAQGSWGGVRQLEGGRAHPYRLEWEGEWAPLEMLDCRLLFPALPDLGYRFSLPAYRLVCWLVQLQGEDLPQVFWSWLLLGQSIGGEA